MRLVATARENILAIEQRPDGIFLYTFRPDGFISDTWHRSIDEAKAQAVYAHGDSVTTWHLVPPDIGDVVAFGRSLPK